MVANAEMAEGPRFESQKYLDDETVQNRKELYTSAIFPLSWYASDFGVDALVDDGGTPRSPNGE